MSVANTFISDQILENNMKLKCNCVETQLKLVWDLVVNTITDLWSLSNSVKVIIQRTQ